MEEEGIACLVASNLHWTRADRYPAAIIDNIVLARITNDERPLKRVIKKFHNYISVSTTSAKLSDDTAQIGPIDDAKEAFLIELASLQLLLKKSVMTCEAETRQVEEYQKERRKIGIAAIARSNSCGNNWYSIIQNRNMSH